MTHMSHLNLNLLLIRPKLIALSKIISTAYHTVMTYGGAKLPVKSSQADLSYNDCTLFSGGQWSRCSQCKDRNAETSSWSDQVELSAGLKWSKDHQIITTDLQWRLSPVPLQTSQSNYVDY